MLVLAVDPGYKESALVVYDNGTIVEHVILDNDAMLVRLAEQPRFPRAEHDCVLVMEQMQLFAARFVGVEVFDSVHWSGRFHQVFVPGRVDRLLRAKVRGHLGASKGGDKAVREALIGRYGPYKETAIGTRSKPGPLFGIATHEWSALAIAVTWWDLHNTETF